MGIPCGSPNMLRFSHFTKALLTPRLPDMHSLKGGGQVLTAQPLSDGLEEETREILTCGERTQQEGSRSPLRPPQRQPLLHSLALLGSPVLPLPPRNKNSSYLQSCMACSNLFAVRY